MMIISSFGYKSKRSFAEKVGVAQTSLNDILKGAEPKYSTLSKILKAEPLISAEWLMRGEGDMRVGNNDGMIIDNMEDYISAKEKGLKLLPEIDFKLAGGETQLFGTDSILRYWHLPECNDCDVVVQVVGSSMSPTYPPGCWVALKKYSFPENPNSIPFGNVFGIVIRDEDTGDTHAHIKVLRRHKDEKKSKEYWIAHSINTEEFDDFDIKIKDVIGLWVVKQHIVSDML